MSDSKQRNRIGQAFHRHAGEYDRHAVVQKQVAAKLVSLVERQVPAEPGRLLDIGCGTGALLSALRGSFPATRLYGVDLAFNMALHSRERLGETATIVNADAEVLPFRSGSFDLVVSASTLQWLPRLDSCLAECRRVLAPGGMLCLAFFGGKTLWELQESYRKSLTSRYGEDDERIARLHRFRQCRDVEQALEGMDFEQVMVASEIEMEFHPDVKTVLRSIKGVGAATASRSDSSGGLGWRAALNDMSDYYQEHFSRDGLIPVTYEVIYVVAHGGKSAVQ